MLCAHLSLFGEPPSRFDLFGMSLFSMTMRHLHFRAYLEVWSLIQGLLP